MCNPFVQKGTIYEKSALHRRHLRRMSHLRPPKAAFCDCEFFIQRVAEHNPASGGFRKKIFLKDFRESLRVQIRE
jgi:hypothetical protein